MKLRQGSGKDRQGMAFKAKGEVCWVTMGHLRVTIGHLRATVGHLGLTIGYLKATVVHITQLHFSQLILV